MHSLYYVDEWGGVKMESLESIGKLTRAFVNAMVTETNTYIQVYNASTLFEKFTQIQMTTLFFPFSH